MTDTIDDIDKPYREGDSVHTNRAIILYSTEDELINDIALMFFDSMNTQCIPADYAQCVIKK